jgi:hypothetical protein
VKKDGTDVHKLRYNMCTENPLLGIQGWNEIKEHHDLPDNVIVTFKYHGNNFFEVQESEEITSFQQIPPWHSLSLDPARTQFFDVEVANCQFGLPKLVRFDHSYNTPMFALLFFISIK